MEMICCTLDILEVVMYASSLDKGTLSMRNQFVQVGGGGSLF
jgi:hypothetical protein